MRHFGTLAQKNHLVFVEAFFQHPNPHIFCEDLVNVYHDASSSRAEVRRDKATLEAPSGGQTGVSAPLVSYRAPPMRCYPYAICSLPAFQPFQRPCVQMADPCPQADLPHVDGVIVSDRVRQDHEPRKKRASRKSEDTDEESDSDSEVEDYKDEKSEVEGDGGGGVAAADEDEADEEEWDESAATAHEEADKNQDKDEEAGASGGKNKSKGVRRRRGGREDGGKTLVAGSEKKKRAPRWSKKVRMSSIIDSGGKDEVWMLCGKNLVVLYVTGKCLERGT